MTEHNKFKPELIEMIAVFPGPIFDKERSYNQDRWQAQGLIEPDDEAVQRLHQRNVAAVAEKEGAEKAAGIYKDLLAKDRVYIKDGNLKSHLAGFAGRLSITASSKSRPVVVDGQKNAITEEDGLIYSGAIIRISLLPWYTNGKYGRRVGATLRGVQFVRDGEPLVAGGGAANMDDFDIIEDDVERFSVA